MIRFATNSFSWHPTYNKGIGDLTAEDICRQAFECGAEGIEIEPARVSKAALDEIGIVLSGASTGGPLFDEWTVADADQVVSVAAEARAYGGEYVFFTAAPKGGWGADVPVTPDNLKLAGERFNTLAQRVRAEGVTIGLHNHAATPQGLAAELALLREHTDLALVGLYFDVAWAFTGGGDPLAILGEFGPRCMGFHFRNATADKVPTEGLEGGALDIPALVEGIKAPGYSGWVALELWHRDDVPTTKSMVECQTEALRYLKCLFA
jgi:sugar phosphate isomerase/epimerase